MELRNERGEITQLADNLTIKEIQEMGYTIDLCDEAFDPNEHWHANGDNSATRGEFPEDQIAFLSNKKSEAMQVLPAYQPRIF